jgi:NodT family efflux transporter outer membrane factor (OMF) lipoprotein
LLSDPVLDELMQKAQAANRDLKQAVAVIDEARAQLGVASGDEMPVIDVGTFAGMNELSDNGPLNKVAPDGGFSPHGMWEVGFDASWEIDVFGGIRRNIESAAAGMGVSVENYRDVLVTLLAEVARHYVDARTFQQRLVYALGNVQTQTRAVELARARYETGVSSDLDVAQAEFNLANTQAVIPLLETGLQLTLNRLAVIVGEQPGAIDEQLREVRPIPALSAEVAIGIPAELLRQRPDVRRAERELASQTAQIGVATAALYPRFSLSGSFALQSRDLSELAESSSIKWNFGVPIRWNLFDRDRIRQSIKVEEARTNQLLYEYEQTVLDALADVEDSGLAYTKQQEHRDYLGDAVSANRRAVTLVEDQYVTGVTDFQNVLDTQRSLFVAEDQLALSEGKIVTHLISLYKALGGGWAVAPEPGPAESSPEAKP